MHSSHAQRARVAATTAQRAAHSADPSTNDSRVRLVLHTIDVHIRAAYVRLSRVKRIAFGRGRWRQDDAAVGKYRPWVQWFKDVEAFQVAGGSEADAIALPLEMLSLVRELYREGGTPALEEALQHEAITDGKDRAELMELATAKMRTPELYARVIESLQHERAAVDALVDRLQREQLVAARRVP